MAATARTYVLWQCTLCIAQPAVPRAMGAAQMTAQDITATRLLEARRALQVFATDNLTVRCGGAGTALYAVKVFRRTGRDSVRYFVQR